MEYKNQTYYWILPLNEGKWTMARHIEGTWHFIDGRCRLTNDLGQTGEEIKSNDELFNQRRMHDELIKAVSRLILANEDSHTLMTPYFNDLKQLLKQAE